MKDGDTTTQPLRRTDEEHEAFMAQIVKDFDHSKYATEKPLEEAPEDRYFSNLDDYKHYRSVFLPAAEEVWESDPESKQAYIEKNGGDVESAFGKFLNDYEKYQQESSTK